MMAPMAMLNPTITYENVVSISLTAERVVSSDGPEKCRHPLMDQLGCIAA